MQCEVPLKKRMIWLDKERKKERNVLNLLFAFWWKNLLCFFFFFLFPFSSASIGWFRSNFAKIEKDLETQPSFIHNHLLSLLFL